MSEQDTGQASAEVTAAPPGAAVPPVGTGAAPASRRAIAWWAAVLLLPLAWTVAAWIVEAVRIPSDADRAAAAAAIRAGWQPGDALAIAPDWALRNLSVVGDLEPTFDPRLAERPPAAQRLWVLAEPEGEATLQALAARHPVEEQQVHGRLRVARFRLDQARGFHAVDHLAGARVSLEGKGAPVPCDRWREARWDCTGRPDWQHVSAEFLDVEMGPRRALWAHPPPAGETLWLRFPGVTLGSVLELWGGHTVHGAQSAKAPVEVRALLDGQELGRVRFAPAYPMTVQRLDTAALAGRQGELALAIDTVDNGANHFALDAVIPAATP